MPDLFTKPRIPGTKIGWAGEQIARIPPSFADIVAVPLTHDWGPLGSDAPGTDKRQGGPQLVTSFAEWESLFGTGNTAGRTAVAGAFAGQGLDGTGGAGGVLVYRMGTGASRASVTLDNTAAAAAITINARYKGTRGNGLSVVVEDDPADNTRDRARILFNGVEQHRVSYPAADINALGAAINALSSPYATAVVNASGTALAATAGTSLTGGTDGSAPNLADHDAALSSVEFKPFSILAPANLTDPTIRAAYVAWVDEQENANRPVLLVIGGAAAEGTFHDDLLDADLSTAQLAPRFAGILAARGESKALTYAEIAGLTIATTGTGLTDAAVRSAAINNPHVVNIGVAAAADELRPAIDAGVTVLMQASMPNAELRVAQGVTTFTSKNVPGRPYDVFSEPRFIRIMDIFERGMKAWGDDIVIGDLPVNDDTRATVYGEAKRRVESLLSRGLILPGDSARDIPEPFVNVDPPNDPSLADAVPFTFGWQFARTANYVIGNGTVR